MPRNGSSSEGSSSSEDSSSDDDLLLSIPRPGVVFGEGVVGDSDDPFDSPSKVLFKSCLGATKMCGGAEASLQRQGGQQQHHREKERERESLRARACSRLCLGVRAAGLSAGARVDRLGAARARSPRRRPRLGPRGGLVCGQSKASKSGGHFSARHGRLGSGSAGGLLAARAVANKRLRLFSSSRALPPTSALLETRRHTSSLEDQPSVQPC